MPINEFFCFFLHNSLIRDEEIIGVNENDVIFDCNSREVDINFHLNG